MKGYNISSVQEIIKEVDKILEIARNRVKNTDPLSNGRAFSYFLALRKAKEKIHEIAEADCVGEYD